MIIIWSVFGAISGLTEYVIQLTTFSKLKRSPKERDLQSQKKKKNGGFDKDMSVYFARMCRNFGSETSLDTTC